MDKFIFNYSENDTTKDSNILDKNDNEFEKLSIDPKFKYFINYSKRKSNKTQGYKYNTSSINANHENRE